MIPSIIAKARQISAEAGDASDAVVIEVLARMVAVSTSGMSSGFSRMPPAQPVRIKPQPRSLDE